jgi:hypothetical protein
VAPGSRPPATQAICPGEAADVDASGIALRDCAGATLTTWYEGAAAIGSGPVLRVLPAVTTTYSVLAQCETDPACWVLEHARVVVEQPPSPGTASARDLAGCGVGIEVSWSPATFHGVTGLGVTNVHRSTGSCADALALPPIATGLTGTRWVDVDTVPGETYAYAVEAEDGTVGSPCASLRGAHHGGAAARACAGPPVIDIADDAFPEGVGATLRASHEDHVVWLRWDAARSLVGDEHFHLLKTWEHPTRAFVHVNGEASGVRAHVEEDRTSWLQIFDLRVANACEELSLPDFPPSREW